MLKIYEYMYELEIDGNLYCLEKKDTYILEIMRLLTSIFERRKKDYKKNITWATLTGEIHAELKRLNEEEFLIIINGKVIPFNFYELTKEFIEDMERDEKNINDDIKELIKENIEILKKYVKEFEKEYEIN